MPRDYESMSLEGLVAEAVSLAGGEHRCDLLGHKWVFIGGRHCGCHDAAACSFPVHQCEACGDCDYGYNEEAKEVRARCREMSDDIFGLLAEAEAW